MKIFSDLKNLAPKACALTLIMSQSALAQSSEQSQQGQQRFDPTPFLTAMVEYRLLAFSCEEVIPGSPLRDSSQISDFFMTLGQNPPVGSDSSTDKIVYALVRSQAAAICTDRLREAGLTYGSEAVIYEEMKPEAWPTAPSISAGPWCQSESCSELRVVRGGTLFN